MFLISDINNQDEYSDNMLYGLYCPYNKRFVYLNTNRHVLAHTAFMFSSRFELWLCRIDCAENFEPNIIDNEVAQNWSIDFDGNAAVGARSIFSARHTVEVPLLKYAGKVEVPIAALEDIEYVRYVINLFARIRANIEQPRYDDYSHEIDFVYSSTVHPPFESTRANFFAKVFETVYLESNFAQAKNKIEALNNEYQSIL